MYVDCWHELPQTLLGSSDAERSCVTSYIFHISGWFLSYSKNYSSILCNGPFLRLLMFIPTIQKKRKKHIFRIIFLMHLASHTLNAPSTAWKESSENVQPCHGQECTGLTQAVLIMPASMFPGETALNKLDSTFSSSVVKWGPPKTKDKLYKQLRQSPLKTATQRS